MIEGTEVTRYLTMLPRTLSCFALFFMEHIMAYSHHDTYSPVENDKPMTEKENINCRTTFLHRCYLFFHGHS